MGITISLGIQKGGCGKTTTTGLTAYLLSQQYRVLAVDFDSQGNLTQFLTQRNIYDFTKHTVLEACKEQDARPYIVPVSDTLHMLTAEDFLAGFPQWLYREYKGDPTSVLRTTLDTVKSDYDFILLDLPPNLGDHTINGLTASDFAVVMLQSEPFCYDALDRYLELLGHVQSRNQDLRLAGILTTMLDSRASLDSAILERARGEYGDIIFETTIRRRSRIKEFTVTGIQSHLKADRDALENYSEFVKELTQRVSQ